MVKAAAMYFQKYANELDHQYINDCIHVDPDLHAPFDYPTD